MSTPEGRTPVAASTIGPPSGSYSQGIRVGDLLFLSGQVASLPDGTVVRDSVTAQVRQALLNLDEVAKAAGSRLTNAVQVRVYLKDLKDFSEMTPSTRATSTSHSQHGQPSSRTSLTSRSR